MHNRCSMKISHFLHCRIYENISLPSFIPGLLEIGIIDIGDWRMLSHGGCSVPCRMWNSISRLYPLNTNSTSQDVAKFPGGAQSPQVENHCPRSPAWSMSSFPPNLTFEAYSDPLTPSSLTPSSNPLYPAWLFKATLIMASWGTGIFLSFVSWRVPKHLTHNWFQCIFVE